MKYPWMPLFWGDFLANTLHLSAQEIGAYFLLIAHAWEHGAKVHFNDARRIARVRSDHWPRVFRKLEPFFEWEKDPKTGSLSWGTHHRVHYELLKVSELSNKRKDAALQMHAKRRANASHPPSPSSDKSKNSYLRKGRAKARQTQLHQDWRPADLTTDQQADFEQFCDHAKANGRLCADWNAAWRNWKRKAAEFKRPNGGYGGRPPRPGSWEDRQEKTANVVAELHQYLARNANESGSGGDASDQDDWLLPGRKST